MAPKRFWLHDIQRTRKEDAKEEASWAVPGPWKGEVSRSCPNCEILGE